MVKWIEKIVLIFAFIGNVRFQRLEVLILWLLESFGKLRHRPISDYYACLPRNTLDLVGDEIAVCLRFLVQLCCEARFIKERVSLVDMVLALGVEDIQ